MFHPLVPVTPFHRQVDPIQALANPAVQLCKRAADSAYRTGIKRTKSRMLARNDARQAFHRALPPLSSIENIGDFIDCVAFAISAGFVVNGEEVQLLYSARRALRAITSRPGNKRRPAI